MASGLPVITDDVGVNRAIVKDGVTGILVKDVDETLDLVLGEFVVEADDRNDHVVDQDVVLYWTDEQKRIITGADIFGHLLRGIAQRVPMDPLDRAEESGLRPES